MTIFIAVPKVDAAIASLSTITARLIPEARSQQVEALIKRRQEIEVPQALSRIESAIESTSAKPARSQFPSVLPVTGISVLEGEDDQLESLQELLPGYDVIEDVPLTLVRPVKFGESVSEEESLDTWHLEATQILRARSSGFTGRGQGVGVAVLDTGVEEVEEISGRVTSAFQLNALTGTAESIATRDTDGHGTHVAGIIAGKRVGVAPAADLMNFIMIPGGSGNLSDFIFAIEFVAIRPEISILNMSAGIRGYNSGMSRAIETALAVGVLPVIAIGNEGRNTSRSPGNYSNVLSVGASTKLDRIANFSGGGTMVVDNQSYTIPDLVAPGQEITSCVIGGGYEAWDGTSMATPVVAGIAALIVERFPMISEPDLRDEILSALRLLPEIPEQRQGEGLAQLPRHLWMTFA